MTAQHFEEWFHDALMPNIQPNSLIVMDNVPYHSRRLEPVPTMNSRKQVMQDWLTSHRICFPECAFKRKYAVDEIARAAGHEVVRILGIKAS